MEVSGGSDGRSQPGVTLLVVRPHPDDESSATGGLLAYYHARGVRTGVVICTGGEEGGIHDPTLDPVADRPRLRAIREQELRHACALLGVAELRMLGYRDSGMPGTPANQHRDAFVRADPGEAAGRLVRLIRGLRPRVIVTEPPGGPLYAPGPCDVPSGEPRGLPGRWGCAGISRGWPGVACGQALCHCPDR